MAKYRKKPVVIDAVQFDGTPLGALNVFEEFDIQGAKFIPDYDLRTGTLFIPTLEDGKMGEAKHIASREDWIIKGVRGEFYPCKPDIFEETYEAVEEP